MTGENGEPIGFGADLLVIVDAHRQGQVAVAITAFAQHRERLVTEYVGVFAIDADDLVGGARVVLVAADLLLGFGDEVPLVRRQVATK